MNKLYLSDTLFSKSLDNRDDLYRLIITARPEIYVISPKWNKGTFAAPGKFISFGKEEGISVSNYKGEEKELLKSLERGNFDPNAIYILNVKKETAASLRAKRIMCLSQNDFKTEKNILIDDVIIYSPLANDTGYGWKTVLNPISYLPSNSLLIIDRYLFKSNMLSGIKNLESILDAILPIEGNKTTPYKIYLIISHKQKEEPYRECNSKCNTIIERLNLPRRHYKIELFLYSVSNLCKTYYPITHNRRFILDSGRLEATYKLDAFKYQSSLCSQSLFVEHLFSKANLNGAGDSTYKANYDDWDAFTSFKEECKRKNWFVEDIRNPNKPIVIFKHLSNEL